MDKQLTEWLVEKIHPSFPIETALDLLKVYIIHFSSKVHSLEKMTISRNRIEINFSDYTKTIVITQDRVIEVSEDKDYRSLYSIDGFTRRMYLILFTAILTGNIPPIWAIL